MKIDTSLLSSNNVLFLLVGGLFALELSLFWPGVLRVDSIDQLNQALASSFSDHHPPLMAFYWSLLNNIYPGPGLMLATHLLLFWGSVYNFARSFDIKALRLSYLIISMFPPLLIFHPFILKDIGFAHSYFFVMSCLTYCTLKQKKPSLMTLLGLTIVLFYGTAVKFQAMFILPIFTFWIGHLCCREYKNAAIRGVGIFVFLYAGISLFNAQVSTPSQSWQYVKLYDLAGISLRMGQNYFPAFVTEHSGFNMQRLRELYNPTRVDDLAFIPDPVLIKGNNDQQSKELWWYWLRTITNHPFAYLEHRFSIFWEQINRSFIKSENEIQSCKEDINPNLLMIASCLEKWHLIQIAKMLTAFSFFLPLQLIYFLVGIYCRKKPLGTVMLFINGAGLGLLLTVFFFSMAAEARYIYLTLGCLHFSHPLIYALWLSYKNKTNQLT